MKKGLLLVPFMSGKGGTETVIKNLFNAYNDSSANKNYQLTVYSIGGCDDYSWAQPVHDIVIKKISSSRIVRTSYYLTCLPFYLYRVIKSEKPDFIISTNPVMWFLSYHVVKLLRYNTKVISWYHYSLRRKPVKSLFLKAADGYLAISDSIKKDLIDSRIQGSKVFTIYNPITTDQTLIGRPVDGVARFIYLGRIDWDEQKNLRDLVIACCGLRGKWRLDLYGDDTNTQKVKEYLREKKMSSQVEFHGFVSKPWQKISQASALVLCSNFEGYPMVLAEAMSHGIFCISSNIEGSNEMVNTKNGVLYEPHNFKELTAQMQRVIDQPQSLPEQSKIQSTVNKLLPKNYLTRFSNALEAILKL